MVRQRAKVLHGYVHPPVSEKVDSWKKGAGQRPRWPLGSEAKAIVNAHAPLRLVGALYLVIIERAKTVANGQVC